MVTQAKGSAYIEQGKTKVIVSVFDPREIPNRTEYSLKGEIFCQFKYAPFSCPKRRQHQQDSEEKQYSAILKQALEPAVCRHEFPNFQVDIYALVLENDGAALSAAITCAGLALSQAGVPMYDLITSVTLGVQKDRKFLDPTLKEEQLCDVAVEGSEDRGVVVLSMLHTHEQVAQVYQSGNFGLETLTESIQILTRTAKEIVPLVQKCLVKHVAKCVKKDAETWSFYNKPYASSFWNLEIQCVNVIPYFLCCFLILEVIF